MKTRVIFAIILALALMSGALAHTCSPMAYSRSVSAAAKAVFGKIEIAGKLLASLPKL